MRKSFVIVALTALTSWAAFATDEVARYETFLGYDFVRFNPNSGFIPSFNANGGSGQFAYNFDKWFSAVVDLGAVNKGTLGGSPIDTTVVNFVAGPRLNWHNGSRFKPYVQALFGGAYGTSSALISAVVVPGTTPMPFAIPTSPVSARLVTSTTNFAMLTGGGLDIRFGKHFSFRPIEVDYYLTRMPGFFNSNQTSQNNFRYSAGVNFLFGAQ